MWIPDKKRLVKICLHSQGQDVETPWAEDLGEVPGRPGARRVRLANVPILYTKPTYGDVIVVEPDTTYRKLTWEVRDPIEEDGGRYTVIVEYVVPASGDVPTAFSALIEVGMKVNVRVQGCFAPKEDQPGLACLAVPVAVDARTVLAYFGRQDLPMSLTLVHPL